MATPLINFSGIASGIDSASLIKALMDRERSARITPLEDKITQLKDQDEAYGKLKELLNALQSAAAKFRVVNGGALSKTGNSSDETVASLTAGNAATNGTYSLEVGALAKNGTYTLGSQSITYTSSSQAINPNISGGDNSVKVEIGTGSEKETVNMTLTSSTTLSDFVTEFNSNSTKATASIVNVGTSGSPNYKVMISSNNSGADKGTIAVTLGSGITDPDGNPVTTDGAWDSNSLDQASDASFSIPGVGTNIKRATNSITDLLPGLTINLKGTGTTSLSVIDNPGGTTQAVQGFVDAWNEVVKYINENDAIKREEKNGVANNIFGKLARTSIDENLMSALRGALSGASISGGSVNTTADLGIATQRDGTLTFDSTAFANALNADPESVRTLTEGLGETLASTAGTIAQFTQFNGLIDAATTSDSDQISQYQDRMAEIEKSLSGEEDSLNARFSRLEALMGKLNSQQASLSSILPK
jgi:flagellar hook-associated protein 2